MGLKFTSQECPGKLNAKRIAIQRQHLAFNSRCKRYISAASDVPPGEALCFILYTVWPEILAGNLFWRIGGFERNPPIFHPPKFNSCTV